MIPNEDWEQTPLSVKQWVASREQGIQELEPQLAAQQQQISELQTRSPVTARKTESHLIQLIDAPLVRPAASPETPSKKK
jgi:uncharacterized coiled-coil protein SlyX